MKVKIGSRDQKWAFIQVSDNGPGINAEHLPHLFERFYRVDQSRNRTLPQVDFELEPETATKSAKLNSTGSGLGLSIVEWVVAAHKGEIKVESHLGAGTIFEVQFPLLFPIVETND